MESTESKNFKKMKQDLIKYQLMFNWTGGNLALYKFFFGIIEWDFPDSEVPQLKIKKFLLEIPMSSQDQEDIKQLQKVIRTNDHQITRHNNK